MVRTMVRLAAILILGAILAPLLIGQIGAGTICVAPLPKQLPKTAATPELFCPSGKLSFKIDGEKAVPWSREESAEIAGLDLNQRHRVVVLCDGKAQQSFSFRFSEFKEQQLCLFLNDLYQTAQLWERKRSPWCKCR